MRAFNYCNIGTRDGYFLVTQTEHQGISESGNENIQNVFPKDPEKCSKRRSKSIPSCFDPNGDPKSGKLKSRKMKYFKLSRKLFNYITVYNKKQTDIGNINR